MFTVKHLSLPSSLRALRHRNYLLLISGQIFSLTGAWMQSTAQGWLVYNLTSDAFLLGLVGFAAGVPILALGLFAGVVADSVNRHKLIICMQLLLMLQAFTMGALTLLHTPEGEPVIRFWHIIMLSTFAGAVQAFEMPARQSFLMEIVPKQDLGNAIALNSLTFNLARVVGPMLAGRFIAGFQTLRPDRLGFGEGMCFIINGVSFTVLIFQLARMKFPPGAVRPLRASSEKYLLDGLNYVFQRRHIRALLIYVGIIALFGIPYLVLMPVFAKDVFMGDSKTFANLVMSVGIGAMAGGVLLARRKKVTGLTSIILAATIAFCIVITVFSWLRDVRLAYLFLGLAGFSMVTAMISSQTLIQLLVAERFRGRVMSLYTMMAVGLFPFGSLIAGAEAHWLGAPLAQTINAAVCIITAMVFATRLPALRQAARATIEYREMLEASELTSPNS